MADPDDPDVLEALASLPTMAHPTASPDGGRVFLHRDEAGDEQNDVYALAPDGAAAAVVRVWSPHRPPNRGRPVRHLPSRTLLVGFGAREATVRA